jgi:multidrug efflux pump subunit AcrA (membrane-fusion protein)
MVPSPSLVLTTDKNRITNMHTMKMNTTTARATTAARDTCPSAMSVALALTIALALSTQVSAEQSLVVDEMVVVLIDAVNVPASATGIIATISAREGDSVKAGQELGTLDDRKPRLEQSLARTQLKIATENAEHGLATELAEKKLAQQQQLTKQHEIAREIADKKAGNDVRILASKKSEAVAKIELDRATQARREFADSVSQSEIDGLRLAYDRTSLETVQADFDRQIDVLHATAENEVAKGHTLSIERSKIEVAQAVTNQRVQQLQVDMQKHQTELAELAALECKIIAPLDGVVVELFRAKGDWVTAGDPVVRVIRLNRLRAEGYIESDRINSIRNDRNVHLTIQTGADSFVQREGEIVFISPEIDPVNNQVRFWVEFDNPQLDVLPGMRSSLRSTP